MSRAALDSALNTIIGKTAEKVAGLGFTRRGAALKVLGGGNSAIIEFQKSTTSSNEKILFTINLAVVCGGLLEQEQPALHKAKSLDAHLRQRIGMLVPGRPDKWWEITASTNVDELAAEVSDLVFTQGAPYVRRYLETNELAALWRSGESPGLTETQRIRYLNKLSAHGEA